jgi:DNA-binding MarR family transcriptional regulator
MNVRRASRAITKIYDQALESSGLKTTQFSILMNIDAHGPLNISALARILTLDRTTLVRNLKPLEKAGFVEDTPSQDPRERQVRLTEHGRQAINGALPHWKNAQRRMRQQVGPENLHTLGQITSILEGLACDQDEPAP